MIDPFLKNEPNLTELQVHECILGAEGCRMLSLALGGSRNKSLKKTYVINE